MPKKITNADFPGFVETKVNKGSLGLGKKVPAFKVSTTAKEPFSLNDMKGKKLVLYFYPKDSTSGCTKEGHDFTSFYKKFKRLNTEVLGVSRDSLKSHNKFIENEGFSFSLLSDEDEQVCRLFDVMKEKSMYGKKYMGVERSTFVIDENGKLIKEWRKVKVPGHVEEVFEFVKSQKDQ